MSTYVAGMANTKMPKVSLITVCKNEADSIESTLFSVCEQSFSDREYIVVDGDSTDGTVNIIESYADQIDTIVSEADDGIYSAMNKGLTLSHGEYVYFLNGGDRLFNSSVLKDIFAETSAADIIYGDMVFDCGGGKLERKAQPERMSYARFIATSLWQPAALVRKEVFDRVGKFNEELKICADYEFFIKAIFHEKVCLKYIPIPFSVFDTRGISRRTETRDLHRRERALIQKQYFPFMYYVLARAKPYLEAQQDRRSARLVLSALAKINDSLRIGKY